MTERLREVIVFDWDIATDTANWTKSTDTGNYQERQYSQASKRIQSATRIHSEDIPLLTELSHKIREGALYSKAEFRYLNRRKEYNWCRIHAITEFDNNGSAIKAKGIISDINDEISAMDRLRRRAETDALTGVYNRAETEAQVRHHLKMKPIQQSALLMIDTDNFKQINDVKGHVLGDMVLAEMASGMKKSMGEKDIVGRIGGDEFAVFMKELAAPEAAAQKAQELSEMFRHLFENEKKALQVTCSIGVALYPQDGKDFKSLYNSADQALYEAKKQGKNRFVIYDKDLFGKIHDIECSSLGAAIDSEHLSNGKTDTLAGYIFKILYNMEDNDEAINSLLKIVGKRFDVSRAYVFENTEDGRFCSNTYEWCNEGITPQIEHLQSVAYSMFGGNYEKLFDEDSIFYCRDTSKLEDDKVALFKQQGIYSTLQCALWKEKKFSGFVGFDECTGLRLWTKDEVSALSLISQILSTFLQKKRLMERNIELEKRLHALNDNQE